MALQLSFNVADKCTTIHLKGSLNEYSSSLDGVDVNLILPKKTDS